VNKIILMGRLTKDPNVSMTPNGKAVTRFTMAVDRPYRGKDGKTEADFINVVAWGKTGEIIGNNINKGQRILIEGRLEINPFDAKDGTRKYITQVNAEHMDFIESKPKGTQTRPAQQSGFTKQQDPMQSFGSEVGFDEEIPF
jgi:single-strand DNA-binding protein